MPSVYLLRHCDYANPRNIQPGRLPVELSQAGRTHAQRLQAFFADKRISMLYSSAVVRCQQTAEIVSGGNIPVVYDPRILETLSAYQGYWGDNKHEEGYHFFSHIPELGGENFAAILQRMADFWKEVSTGLTENIIICSHGDPLQILYAHIHGLPMADENADESDIPGWMEKGEFVEIVWENGAVHKTFPQRSA